MERVSAVAHGKAEVLVTFRVDGELRNHLLRPENAQAKQINATYRAYEESATARRTAFDERVAIERESLEAQLRGERAAIDNQAFEVAEAEIEATSSSSRQ